MKKKDIFENFGALKFIKGGSGVLWTAKLSERVKYSRNSPKESVVLGKKERREDRVMHRKCFLRG